MRRAARRDLSEIPIIMALRAAGYLVYRTNDTAIPDLLVNRVNSQKGWLLIENKTDDEDLTGPQKRFWECTMGTAREIARTPAEAVRWADEWIGRAPKFVKGAA